MEGMIDRVLEIVEDIQDFVSYAHCESEHYLSSKGLGRTGLNGFIIGGLLGFHLALLLVLLLLGPSSFIVSALLHWSAYVVILTTFHFMEFFSTSLNQPATLTGDSFLINHSTNYTIAAIASWLEFWIESLFFGRSKLRWWIGLIGFLVALVGQVVRSLAMFQCGENFSHQIAVKKTKDHQLVTAGIYQYLRHPSYFGWFYWSIGTQIILCNPICTLAYAFVSWKFFKERISFEELTLVEFFGDSYREYKRRSHIGIPFI